jgi:hypothetical protein
VSIPRMGIDVRALRPINNPHIHLSATDRCDGEECNRSFHDADGHLVPLPGHIHIHMSDPNGGWRTYGVAINDDEDWQLPDEVYSPSH